MQLKAEKNPTRIGIETDQYNSYSKDVNRALWKG